MSAGKAKEAQRASTNLERRNFLRTAGAAIATVAVGQAALGSLGTARASGTGVDEPLPPELPAAVSRDSDLARMHRELARSLSKPIAERKWVMVIDLEKCVGCSACTVSCIAENHLPPGVVYRPILEENIGVFPNVTRRFVPRPCMQCGDPPCVPVCPVAATWKRQDGIVVVDYDVCIGCRYCIAACPYSARTFDFGEFHGEQADLGKAPFLPVVNGVLPYEGPPNNEYKEDWQRREGASPVGNARKCTFCVHRIERGMLPACVGTCIGGATYFGDVNDPDSLVSELRAATRSFRLKEDQGTEPSVYYLR